MRNKIILSTILLFIILFSSLTTSAVSQEQEFDIFNFLKLGGDFLMNSKIAEMSLEEKVGQLFQIGFSGPQVDSKIKDMIENYHIGGVIYFSRNIENPAQTAELSNQLQELAVNSGAKLPLFISADQEGGTVTRLKGATHFPGNMALGAANNKEFAYLAGEAVGDELKNLGINVNLAPDLDVNNNPDNPVIGVRSFGEDPKLVAELGTSYIKGLQSKGVIATAKHFPGHGDTAVDSHLDLPVIRHSRSRLEEVELYPFKKAIEAGVDSIMTAHIYFPTIEKEKGIPATLSKAVLTDLLREELNFKGLIITDCMEMNAIVNTFGTVEGAVKTIEAGSDTVLVSHSYQKQKKAINAVIKAVKNGRISEERINQSLKRILSLKGKRISLAELKEADENKINFAAHQKIAREIAENAVTVVKNEGVLPLKNIESKKISVIDFEMGRVSLAEDDDKKRNLFFKYLQEELNKVENITLQEGQTITVNNNKIIDSDLVIVCTYNAAVNRDQARIAEKLAAKYDVLVLALRNPYDYKYLNQTQAFITTYDYSPASQKAAVDLIKGEISARGKLPISIK
ncbi:beta-N-acetylhexosaminidase [Halanaerobium kushneri]|uniref:Beta-N-acetylhexosaminidase n=2 Tax=Halanaerobium kushneri TaxID=56779 RepID=A0A1N6QQB6_9FIRM|nr:beta-N-acetylhexosaminidase [Halanaerobium kushneri]